MVSTTEHQRRLDDVEIEFGADWRDQFRPGTTGCHELLDRLGLINDLLEKYVVSHPACILNPEWLTMAERSARMLQELYQAIGSEHLSDD